MARASCIPLRIDASFFVEPANRLTRLTVHSRRAASFPLADFQLVKPITCFLNGLGEYAGARPRIGTRDRNLSQGHNRADGSTAAELTRRRACGVAKSSTSGLSPTPTSSRRFASIPAGEGTISALPGRPSISPERISELIRPFAALSILRVLCGCCAFSLTPTTRQSVHPSSTSGDES